MKIGIFSLPQLNPGKYNIRDNRIDQIDKISKTKKKTYAQVELIDEGLPEADAILVLSDVSVDLILKDLDFIETRLGRVEEEQEEERALLNKLKGTLEEERFISNAQLDTQERQIISAYGLLTAKPVVVAKKEELEDLDSLLAKVVKESGFICFFTTGEKETRAWLIRQGTTAWEAAGAIHSDIQRGFIRAEIISSNDFIQAGGESQAKQAGKLHLEQKNYCMQDGDLVYFRFNK